METFTLLKYWRAGGGGGGAPPPPPSAAFAVVQNQAETYEEEEEDGDDGPFFDMEFAVPDEDEPQKQGNISEDEVEEEEDGDLDLDLDGEREFNFTISSPSTNEHSDANLTFSPSDDLFFNGKLVSLEHSSNGAGAGGGSEQNSRAHLRLTLLKSAAKFRVFMSALKKKKTEMAADGSVGESTKTESPGNPPEKDETQTVKSQNPTKSKFFAVKFKVEEVPIMSLFTRDNSSRASVGTTITTAAAAATTINNNKQKQNSDESTSEENRFSKDIIMQKYLKIVKPLYIRVSRRYGEKLKLSGQLILGAAGAKSGGSPPPPEEKAVTETEPVKVEAQPTTINTKGRNMPAKLKVVYKHLGKSRSASSAVAAAPSRRDDSLLMQQDGIQSAILHCKKSNASRGSDSSLLSRSASDTLREKPSDFKEKATG